MNYPASIKPMEPYSKEEAFTHPDYLYQVKWDGVRYLAFIFAGEVRLQNRRLKIKTRLYPELQSLPRLIKGRGAVIDGEIIALGEDNSPSFPKVLHRDLVKESSPGLQRQVPIYFMAFDLLYLGGENIQNLPLTERLHLLRKNLTQSQDVRITEDHEDGKGLFAVMAERGMEGMVAKKKDAPYRAGEKTSEWLKIKTSRFQDCLLGGYLLKGGRVSSLMVGVYQGSDFLYVGRVSSGLKEAELQALHRELYPYRREGSPFKNSPSPGAKQQVVWLEPTLGLKVEFSQWTPDLKFRSPRMAGFLPFQEGDFILK